MIWGKEIRLLLSYVFPIIRILYTLLTYHIAYVQSKFQDNDKNEMIFLKNTFFMIIQIMEHKRVNVLSTF